MARPVLDQINIVSANMKPTIEFYRLLEVEIAEPSPGKSGAPFHANGDAGGETSLDIDSDAFARVWNAAWRDKGDFGGRVVIGFGVETREAVDETCAKLAQAGHKVLQEPWDAFWGSRYAIVEDPNGIAVGLMSPQDRSKGYWPPEGWTE